MRSRDAILAAVRAARPPAVPRPDVAAAATRFAGPVDPLRAFVHAAEAAGAHVAVGTHGDLPELVAVSRSGGRQVSVLNGERSLAALPPHSFADAAVFVCEAELGVAENGAVWLPLSRLQARSALFLAEHVIVVLQRSRIVPHLHAAYAAIDVRREDFGVFLAGPSKTADIEQALVIGAHGAKRVTVLLVE